ncbi:hypothetical protein GCM10020331_030520 [Ectobacillus funiculus]
MYAFAMPGVFMRKSVTFLFVHATVVFNIKTGHPMEGPPQRELPLIELEVAGGAVYAVGRKYRHE